jgi:arginine decarboxylase
VSINTVSIRVSRGVGSGPTRMAAFDAALIACGVADFNLIRLSSVIPTGAEVVEGSRDEQHQAGHGDLLYCVYADAYTSTPGELAWAGVAWALRSDGSRGGLFVEHAGLSEALLNRDLRASLESMSASRGGMYEPPGQSVISAVCVDHPVCALVIAAYRTAAW